MASFEGMIVEIGLKFRLIIDRLHNTCSDNKSSYLNLSLTGKAFEFQVNHNIQI